MYIKIVHKFDSMKKAQVNQVREHLAKYISDAEKGEEIIITKHGKPVARLAPVKKENPKFPDLKEHRESLTVRGKSLSKTVTESRKKERY